MFFIKKWKNTARATAVSRVSILPTGLIIMRLNQHKGMVLPAVIILSVILLTSFAIWYRKVIFQSFLAERLILQRIDFQECNSLIPLLKARVATLSSAELSQPQNDFLILSGNGSIHWQVDRSALLGEKIAFTFHSGDRNKQPIRLVIGRQQQWFR